MMHKLISLCIGLYFPNKVHNLYIKKNKLIFDKINSSKKHINKAFLNQRLVVSMAV